MHHSWLTPATELRDAGRRGRGVFTTAPVRAGDVVAAFGGRVTDRATFEALPEDRQVHSLQIAEDLFLVCPEQAEAADHINHSCDPNCGIVGNVLVVARRDVGPGEELTFDYAMCDSDPYDEFECWCGAADCRRKVTGNDWMIPELQNRYRGWFSAYLALRIEALRSGTAPTSLL
jgi:hypothetical protein